MHGVYAQWEEVNTSKLVEHGFFNCLSGTCGGSRLNRVESPLIQSFFLVTSGFRLVARPLVE